MSLKGFSDLEVVVGVELDLVKTSKSSLSTFFEDGVSEFSMRLQEVLEKNGYLVSIFGDDVKYAEGIVFVAEDIEIKDIEKEIKKIKHILDTLGVFYKEVKRESGKTYVSDYFQAIEF